MNPRALTTTLALALAFAAPAVAAPPATHSASTSAAPASTADEASELARKLNNPVSSLISVPFQSNWDFGLGDGGGQRYTMNFQPVVPLSISDEWNLIVRTILPVIDQQSVFGPGSGSQSGLGNTTQSFFFSPKKPGPGGMIWGLGPVGYYPTATDRLLGPDQWGVGPTFVALVQPGSWTMGVLANQIWSVQSNDNEPDVNSLFLQPFISYTTKTHTTFSVNTESTYDWTNHQWTVPINAMIQQVFKIGNQPMALQVGGRYYVESPSGGPEWGIRVSFTLLFPTGKHDTASAPHYAK